MIDWKVMLSHLKKIKCLLGQQNLTDYDLIYWENQSFNISTVFNIMFLILKQ